MNKDKAAKQINEKYENILITDDTSHYLLKWNGIKFENTGLPPEDRSLWEGYDYLCSFEGFRDMHQHDMPASYTKPEEECNGKEGFVCLVFKLKNNKGKKIVYGLVEDVGYHYYE